jgi:hypothetical protein
MTVELLPADEHNRYVVVICSEYGVAKSLSAQPKPTPLRHSPTRFNRENSKLFPCQITLCPTRQSPRHNAPLNLPRSYEKPWRGTSMDPTAAQVWVLNRPVDDTP